MTIQSAIYLSGNKRKLYQQIKPHLLSERKTFVDLFGGSGTMSINVVNDNLFDDVIYNEKAKHLYDLQTMIANLESWDWKNLDECHYAYPRTKEGYVDMVKAYNISKDLMLLYMLQTRSNSNMMRFNKSGDWNMTYGERATYKRYRVETHKRLIEGCTLWNKDFGDAVEDILVSGNIKDMVIYVDPPYYNTTATYNENGGWTQNDNTTLLEYCVELQKHGAKVVISNVFENRGVTHQELIDWCSSNENKFDVHHLNINYNNSSFRKGKGITDEVLIVSKENY